MEHIMRWFDVFSGQRRFSYRPSLSPSTSTFFRHSVGAKRSSSVVTVPSDPGVTAVSARSTSTSFNVNSEYERLSSSSAALSAMAVTSAALNGASD